ncbi:hypothetical protein TJA_19440 [Thermus sp. LT1-2-5]
MAPFRHLEGDLPLEAALGSQGEGEGQRLSLTNVGILWIDAHKAQIGSGSATPVATSPAVSSGPAPAGGEEQGEAQS